jgi:hypothetical protein
MGDIDRYIPVPNGQKIPQATMERPKPRPQWSQPRIQMIAGLVAAVAVVEEVEADDEALVGEGVAVADGVEAGRVSHS